MTAGTAGGGDTARRNGSTELCAGAYLSHRCNAMAWGALPHFLGQQAAFQRIIWSITPCSGCRLSSTPLAFSCSCFWPTLEVCAPNRAKACTVFGQQSQSKQSQQQVDSSQVFLASTGTQLVLAKPCSFDRGSLVFVFIMHWFCGWMQAWQLILCYML